MKKLITVGFASFALLSYLIMENLFAHNNVAVVPLGGSDLTAADLAQQRVWRGWVSSGGGKLTPGPYTVSTNRNGQFTVTLDLSVAGLNTSEISGFGVPVLTVRSSIAGDSILFNGAGIGFDGNGNVSTLNFRVSTYDSANALVSKSFTFHYMLSEPNGPNSGLTSSGDLKASIKSMYPDVKCTTKDGYEMCVIGEDF